jgi:hypothetical protein
MQISYMYSVEFSWRAVQAYQKSYGVITDWWGNRTFSYDDTLEHCIQIWKRKCLYLILNKQVKYVDHVLLNLHSLRLWYSVLCDFANIITYRACASKSLSLCQRNTISQIFRIYVYSHLTDLVGVDSIVRMMILRHWVTYFPKLLESGKNRKFNNFLQLRPIVHVQSCV